MKTLLKNGLIINGKNEKAFVGNVIIEDDRIVEINQDKIDEFAGKIIDCSNLVIAPGFIDAHSHNDWNALAKDRVDYAIPLVGQGITTVITGNCGYSTTGYDKDGKYIDLIGSDTFDLDKDNAYPDFKMWLDALDNHTPLNVASFVGHGSVRASINGLVNQEMTKEDYQKMMDLFENALANGAVGVSVGLMYRPGIFVEKDELMDIGRLCKKYDKIMAFHNRANSAVSMGYKKLLGRPHLLRALDEIYDIGMETKCKIENSHLIFVGKKSWKCVDEALAILHKLNDNGIQTGFDMYSYPLGASSITVILPKWYQALPIEKRNKFFTRIRLSILTFITKKLLGFDFDDIQIAYVDNGKEYISKNIAEIAKEKKQSKLKTYLEICNQNNFEGRIYLYKYYNDEIIDRLAKDDLAMFMTDAWYQKEGIQNPAVYNSFARFLRLAKEGHFNSLEDTIYKMSYKTAKHFNIQERGALEVGNYADISIFSLDEIKENPKGDDFPTGMKYVFINGKKVFDNQVFDKELLANSGRSIRVK